MQELKKARTNKSGLSMCDFELGSESKSYNLS